MRTDGGNPFRTIHKKPWNTMGQYGFKLWYMSVDCCEIMVSNLDGFVIVQLRIVVKSISHHLETMAETLARVGIYRGIIRVSSLVQEFVHSQYVDVLHLLCTTLEHGVVTP